LFLREFRPFLRGNALFFKEVALLPKEVTVFLKKLGPFLGENSLFPKELFFLPFVSCFSKYFICSLGNFFTPWGIYIVFLNNLLGINT